MQKIIDAIEAGKLTDEYEKVFIRKAATLNSVNKDTLHRHYNELYDRLKLYEDMYFEINERVEIMLAAAGKKAMQEFITTPDAPVPVKLVTVTYAERRLKYFEQERIRAKWRYETAVQSLKDANPHEPWHDDEISKAGEELQYYDDAVAMLKAETEKKDGSDVWEVVGNFFDGSVVVHCPQCKQEYTFKVTGRGPYPNIPYAKYNYCPNCGIKLKLPELPEEKEGEHDTSVRE